MDIALNITTAPQPIRSKVEQPIVTKPSKKKANSGAGSGFSFEFEKSTQKVKAIVARKRPIPKILEKSIKLPAAIPVASKPKTNETIKKITTPIVGKKSIAFKRKPASPLMEKPKNCESAPKSDSTPIKAHSLGSDLTLNVFSAPKPAAAVRPKLNKIERFAQKRAERDKRQQQKESEVKRPASRKANPPIIVSPENDEPRKEVDELGKPEYGAVDSQARKVNAFRVNRPEFSTVKKVKLFKNTPEIKVLGQRLVKPVTERLFDGSKVETLGLHPHVVKNLADLLSITELTTIQKKAIPKVLEGKDVLVRAQTGSGKTLAYALPMVEKLHEIRPKISRDAGILALVIVPTRELAMQTYELLLKLLKPFTWIVPGVLMGGERRKAEKARLRKGINILVGTPGRLVDHLLHTESFKLNKAKFIVLDEADRLLEMGYERDVRQIVEAIDKQREEMSRETHEPAGHLQRLLLSATLTGAVQKLAGLTLQAPLFIDNSDEDPSKVICAANGYSKEAIEAASADLMGDEEETGVLSIPENLQLSFVVVPPKLRLVSLSGLLAKEHKSRQKLKVIVFMSTMEMVNYHHDLLNEQLTQKVLDEEDEEAAKANAEVDDELEDALLNGLRFFKLHGSMTQTERQGVFKSFRECKSGVLLATDVIGRGIDVPEIDLVIQYSPPQKVSDFVHRVGRTARAGRSGRAILFLSPSESQFVRHLEDKRIRISQVVMDDYLKALKEADNEANTVQEAASNLQHKFEELVIDDKEMHSKACKAFVSWMKFYSTFPKDLKSIFNVKKAHTGHFAKSFGLRDQPKTFTQKYSEPKPQPATNRLTYTERDPEKIKVDRKANKRMFSTTVTNERRNPNPNRRIAMVGNDQRTLSRMVGPKSRSLTISEFDSGLPSAKKRKV